MPWTRHRVQHGRAGRVDVGRRARLFPDRARRAALGESRCRPGALIVPLFCVDGHLFRAELGADRDRRRARIASVAASDLAPALSNGSRIGYLAAASLAFCLILLIQQVEPHRRGRDPAAGRRLPSDAAGVVRARRGRRPARGAGGSPVPVHGRNARDGDRRERRRDAQPRASGAGVRARPGAGARHRRTSSS